MRFNLLVILFFIFTINLKALKLDINMDNYFSVKSLNSIPNESKKYNLSYFTQNSYLSFTLKNIPLEKYDSDIDISIGMRFMSINQSSKTLNSLYINELYRYYDSKNNFFYPDKAFVRFYNFPYENTSFSAGRFPFRVASGLVLDDNQKGFNGIKMDIEKKFYTDKINLFYLQNEDNKYQTTHHLYGINIHKSFGDGLWNIYYIKNKANGKGENLTYIFNNTDKNFYGTSYSIEGDIINYTLDLVFEGGNSKEDLTQKEITHKAYAYNTNAKWITNLPIIGKTSTRVGFMKSSGNTSNNFTTDKSFFSTFSKRYCGFERCGYGEILNGSVYDTAKTTDTPTGFNKNLSGLTISNLGFDIDYKKGKLTFDYFNYTATQSKISSISTFIGSEYNIKYVFEMSKNVNLSLIYGALKLKGEQKSTKLFSISVYSSF